MEENRELEHLVRGIWASAAVLGLIGCLIVGVTFTFGAGTRDASPIGVPALLLGVLGLAGLFRWARRKDASQRSASVESEQSEPEALGPPPTLTPLQRILYAVGCLAAPAVATALLITAATSGYDGTPESTLVAALVWTYLAAVAAGTATWLAVLVHIRRRRDLNHQERARWFWATIFLNILALPVVWFKLLRPLNARIEG